MPRDGRRRKPHGGFVSAGLPGGHGTTRNRRSQTGRFANLPSERARRPTTRRTETLHHRRKRRWCILQFRQRFRGMYRRKTVLRCHDEFEDLVGRIRLATQPIGRGVSGYALNVHRRTLAPRKRRRWHPVRDRETVLSSSTDRVWRCSRAIAVFLPGQLPSHRIRLERHSCTA